MATIETTIDVTTRQIIRRTWRLVDTDNFGGDYPNEQFVAVGIPSEIMARCFADLWNKHQGEDHDRILRVVEHVEVEYKLEPGFEP
jgi:hypothetical protein